MDGPSFFARFRRENGAIPRVKTRAAPLLTSQKYAIYYIYEH